MIVLVLIAERLLSRATVLGPRVWVFVAVFVVHMVVPFATISGQ